MAEIAPGSSARDGDRGRLRFGERGAEVELACSGSRILAWCGHVVGGRE
jgi:hypothetical protein